MRAPQRGVRLLNLLELDDVLADTSALHTSIRYLTRWRWPWTDATNNGVAPSIPRDDNVESVTDPGGKNNDEVKVM